MKNFFLCLLAMSSFALFAKTSTFQDLSFAEEQQVIFENDDITDLYSHYHQDGIEPNSQYDLEWQIVEELIQTSSYLAIIQDQEKIPPLNQQNKDKYMNPDFCDPLIIFVFAHWCGPCKQFTPIVEQLSEEHGQKYQFLKLDIDDQSEMVRSFGVTAIPTIIVVKRGEVKGAIVGAMSKQALWNKVKAILNDS